VAAALETIAQAWFADGRQTFDPVAAVTELAMPVQLIWGRDDQIIPVMHAEALASQVPVHILEGAGHLPHMEKSGTVNRLISRFTDS
jgi:pyruvate dehydrogenase E2 component (dihydrolipoamide acetyltransferase)